MQGNEETRQAIPRSISSWRFVLCLLLFCMPSAPSAQPAGKASSELPRVTFIFTAAHPENRERERLAAEEISLVLDSAKVVTVEIPDFLTASPAKRLQRLQRYLRSSREFIWLTHASLERPYQTALWVVDIPWQPEITDTREIDEADPASLALKIMELRRELSAGPTAVAHHLMADDERPWQTRTETGKRLPWYHDHLAVGLIGTLVVRFPGPELGGGALLHMVPAERFHLQLTCTGGTGPYWVTESTAMRGAWLDIGVLPAIHLSHGQGYVAPSMGFHAIWRRVDVDYVLQDALQGETIHGWSFRLELGLNVGWQVSDFLTLTVEGFIGGSRYKEQSAWREAGDGGTLDTFLSWRFAISTLFFGFQ